MADLPVACTLPTDALGVRRGNLLRPLVQRTTECSELSDGYRLRFAATSDVLRAVMEAVDAERQCCRFLHFTITLEPDGGPITLDLTGSPGTREFLADLFTQG
jgi:hypothetical protein